MEKILTESEKVEMHLRPRYKVIADYPGASFIVGTVLDPDIAVHYVMNNEELDYEKYPHLFRKLEWWEDRTPEEMPSYVKDEFSGKILKAQYTFFDHAIAEVETYAPETGWNIDHIGDLIPATEADYLAYTQPSPLNQEK